MGMHSPAGLTTAQAPSLSLPLEHILAAIASFVALSALLFWRFEGVAAGYWRNPDALVVTHLFTLGWVTMLIMGAAYQLIPVVLQVPIYSEALGHVTFAVFLAGLGIMLWSFWEFQVGLLAGGGSLVVAATALFLFNLAATLFGLERWTLTASYVASSLGHLALAVTWGLVLALNLGYGFLGATSPQNLLAHVAVGFFGWFTVTIFGYAYKLVPMFALAHDRPEVLGRVVLYLMNAGVLGVFAAGVAGAGRLVTAIPLVVLTAGVALFVADLYGVFRQRRRRRLDVTMQFVISALAYLVLTAGLTVTAASGGWARFGSDPRGPLALGAVALLGWVSMLAVGQLYKVVPFLVWYHKYSERVGVEPVPLLRDMFSEPLAQAGLWLSNAGVLGLFGGLLAGASALGRAGAGSWLAGSLVFAWSMAGVFRK